MSQTEMFAFDVASADGPKTFSGRRTATAATPARPDVPLVVAVHGGTYTSAYFDLPGYSLLDQAAALGIPVVALDRPGYVDSTSVDPGESLILANAKALVDAVGEVWRTEGQGRPGVVLIGHSIGGATVCAMAALNPSWPLLGIAVSGCLLEVPAQARDGFNATPDVPYLELPDDMKEQVMFGPEGTYTPDMPVAGRAANAPIPRAELIDINNGWIQRVRSVNAQITVPVHARQGEFDHLWITDEDQMRQFGESFTSAPSVDARLVPYAGHCVEFHRKGAALELEQLAFALGCAVRPN